MMPLTLQDAAVAVVVKNATHQNHSEVENLLLPKLSSIRTIDDYAAVLKMFYGYFQPVENSIHRQLSTLHLPDMPERRNAAFVVADLRSLGCAADNLALCDHLPTIETPAQAFGALYVLEGSTLGGKMIARMLAKNDVVPIAEHSLQFFSGYKEQTGEKWKAFLAALNRQTETEAIVASANTTFLFLRSWIQHSLYHDEHSKL